MLLQDLEIVNGHVRVPSSHEDRELAIRAEPSTHGQTRPPSNRDRDQKHQTRPCEVDRAESLHSLESDPVEDLDIGPFISVDETGKPSSFGPSSALHWPPREANGLTQHVASAEREFVKHSLIAKAALQRQSERHVSLMPDIFGVPTELAMHLLDLHWSRQHHTFLLTYRPAIMRDLLTGGPHVSPFLVHAIFACASKYSNRPEVRDDRGGTSTPGHRFFRRCDELLAGGSLLMQPSIPTVVGLTLLGSTYNARGETSKGWLCTGYALRMVYDLGLHLDPAGITNSPEEVEIRRRVFWGAFICDKLQSLYLGRPVGINLCDAHVSRDFLDTYEEEELYMPYIDTNYPDPRLMGPSGPTPLHSVSVFQQLCLLSKIMARIIGGLYVVGATPHSARSSLQQVDTALKTWRDNLPKELEYDPQPNGANTAHPAPNQMNLHGLYHSLIILLHRPFISDGHLRQATTPAHSWRRCTLAARSITSIALAWRSAYGLAGAPYLLSYNIYVGCTIHVRNAAAEASNNSRREHPSLLAASLSCLEELCTANAGVRRAIKIIERMMEAKNIELRAGMCFFSYFLTILGAT